MEMQEDSDIPEDAKKYMFAEDFISYFMILHGFPDDFRKAITEQYRRLIPRAFNEVIQNCTCFLYCRIAVFNTFMSFGANDKINIGTFVLFAEHLQARYFSNGPINPQKFLYFCTHLAYMAKSFYANGEKEIPKLAVNIIVTTMKVYKTPEVDFWNGLNIAAFKYLKMALECGFIKLSALESVKIQFVVHESDKKENNRTIKVSSIVGKNESNLLKNILVIDDNPDCNGNNQNKTDIKKMSVFDGENCGNETLNDCSLTETDEENFDIGEKKSYKNKSEMKCIPPPEALTQAMTKKKISSKREKLVLKIINGFVNRIEISSPKKEDQVGCSKMEEKENKFKMTYAATRTEIIASPKKKERVNFPKMQQKKSELNVKHSVSRTEVTPSPKTEERAHCPKIQQKDNEFKMTHSEIRTEMTASPRKKERVNYSNMQPKFNEFKMVQSLIRTEILTSPENKERVNKMQQKDNESKMMPHHAVKEIKNSPKKEKRLECSLMKQKNYELKMTEPVIDRSSVSATIENSSKNDNQVYVIENEKTFIKARDDIECSFNRSIEITAEDSEVKVKEEEIEQFNKCKNDTLNNIQNENIFKICTNSITKDEKFAMKDSYTICNTEVTENSTPTTNMPKTCLPNLDVVANNGKENELTYNRFINKNESIRKVDSESVFEMTPKNTKKNYIDNKEQVVHDSCNSVASNQTSCATKSFDEYMQKNTANMEASTCIDGLKNASNVTSMKSSEQEIAGTLLSLSQEDDFIFFNDSKPKTPLASTTVTYSQRMSPRVSEKIDDRLMSSRELNTKLSNSVVKEEIVLSTTNKEFASDEEHITGKLENTKKSETENSPMVTVDFDICDKFVIDIVTSADELELYGETHENFLSKEDYFNSTFDILSITHYMAACYGTEFLDVESVR